MHDLRVMTFNIRGAAFADGANVWPARMDLNIATINRYAPDLIGFQELQTGNLETYQLRLRAYEYLLGPHYNNEEPFAYCAIFWRRSRFTLLDQGGFWLSTTPDRLSGAWGTACFRCANWVKLRHLASGHTFVLLNTHLDHVSEPARVEGARLIAHRLSAPELAGLPAIVTGDFNCDPGTPAYTAFTEAGFVDAFIASGQRDNDDTYTFHGFRGRRVLQEGRIDWILIRSDPPHLCTSTCTIVRDAAPPLYPSDHYPVIADLHIMPETTSTR